uniref:MADF domain-containing protein n=1 Tax=Gadus morhua TaxID=8049 RepID=A0A8C5AS23_GADMO
MSDESLITAVSECPVLYDLTLKAYHDLTKRNQAWRDIPAMLGVTAEVSRKKWKYLRDKYLRERKAERDRKKSGAGATSFKRWKYMAIMGFLERHVKERVTSSNMEQGDYSQEIAPEILQSILSSLQKEKENTLALDEDEHFMLSLVPSLRRLSNQKRAQAHMRMQQVLYDVEFGE